MATGIDSMDTAFSHIFDRLFSPMLTLNAVQIFICFIVRRKLNRMSEIIPVGREQIFNPLAPLNYFFILFIIELKNLSFYYYYY